MLVQVVGSKVVDRGKGIGTGTTGSATGSGSAGTVTAGEAAEPTGVEAMRSAGKEFWGIVHEVLDELEILGLELLTGSLETIDFLELGLLFGQSLADNLAGLGVSSLRIRSAFSLASLTMVSAVWLGSGSGQAEIWRS